jgi:hypothetical protein
LRETPVLERACCTLWGIWCVSPYAETEMGPLKPAAARAELMFWTMSWGSQLRGTQQFSMSHHTDVLATAYSPIAGRRWPLRRRRGG